MKAPTITCGIYLYNTKSEKILVCHATHSPWNNWSIPKGVQDENEELYATAVRELYEETGIEIKQLHILAVHALEAKKYEKQNKILESFLAITDSEIDIESLICHSLTEKGFPEVDKYKWVTLEDAWKVLHEAQQKNGSAIEELIRSIS